LAGPLAPFALAIVVVSAFAGGACRAEPDEGPAPARAVTAARKAQPPPPCDAKDDPLLEGTFRDDFERTELGDAWRSTSYGAYYIRNGRLCIAKPRNHPIWLKRRLPENVRIEFEAIPLSTNADVKVELFGDGCAFDTEGRAYTATGYVAVLGAHNNSEHWLARLSEHGADLRKSALVAGAPSLATSKLIANTTYRVELARVDGRTLTFTANGVPIHRFDDPQPLSGPGHDHFAFSGWDAPVCFDKLVITPGGAPAAGAPANEPDAPGATTVPGATTDGALGTDGAAGGGRLDTGRTPG
jgi:hypothetical protein